MLYVVWRLNLIEGEEEYLLAINASKKRLFEAVRRSRC